MNKEKIKDKLNTVGTLWLILDTSVEIYISFAPLSYFCSPSKCLPSLSKFAASLIDFANSISSSGY